MQRTLKEANSGCAGRNRLRGHQPLTHLIGFGAYVRLCVLKPRDGAVAEAAHYCHQCVEVLQLQQLLWTRRSEGESGDIKGLYKPTPNCVFFWGWGHKKAAEVKKVHSVRWQKDTGVNKPWLGETFGAADMRLIWVHQDYWAYTFFMANRRPPWCPLARVVYDWESVGSQLCGRAARGGSFDWAKTPFGIKWQSNVKVSAALEK